MITPVSYTHLDVYKRQIHRLAAKLGVEGDGHDFERKAEVLPQPRETDGQSYAVLAARNAHQNACLLYTSPAPQLPVRQLLPLRQRLWTVCPI